MKAQWQTVMKPAFLNDIKKLQPREIHQVMEKINVLAQDPQPDGKQKRHLLHCSGGLCRIRAGDYRIFYTYNHPIVTIYKLDRREKDTYKDCPEADYDFMTEDEIEIEADQLDLTERPHANTATTQPDW